MELPQIAAIVYLLLVLISSGVFIKLDKPTRFFEWLMLVFASVLVPVCGAFLIGAVVGIALAFFRVVLVALGLN